MGSEERMRELVLSFTEDPEWLPSASQDITDAIHAELSDVDMRESSSSRAITFVLEWAVLEHAYTFPWVGLEAGASQSRTTEQSKSFPIRSS
jgi:hypothetical protein